MNTLDAAPVDPSLAYSEATQNDILRRKMDMDALRKHLGGDANKETKLREACEGFEAIFLQKMWEQMRKTVPKDGYLHSKDQETYQSLFDVELCKKMAGAGGIGLADMLYEQLAQQLEKSVSSTKPTENASRITIPPAEGLLPGLPVGLVETKAPPRAEELKAEDLYSPLPDEKEESSSGKQREKEPGRSSIDAALYEIKADLGIAPDQTPAEAVKAWAQERDYLVGGGLDAGPDAIRNPEHSDAHGAAAVVPVVATDLGPGPAQRQGAKAPEPTASSWQGKGPVSATPRPFSPFAARARNIHKTETPAPVASEAKKAPVRTQKAQPAPAAAAEAPPARRGLVPDETLWPLNGEQHNVVSVFGWEEEPSSGRRHWNPGVRIEAAAGSPVRAVLPGTVVYAGERDGQGFSVVLEHKGGYRSYYGNLEKNPLQPGERVKHGAEFAQIAANPATTESGEKSSSLYFEIKRGEMAINPENAILHLSASAR